MLVAAAVCPHPPILVPALAAGAAPELDECRAACGRAIDAVLRCDLDVLALVGGGPATRRHEPAAAGSLAGYGLADPDEPVGSTTLPLSLTVGRWLLAARPTPPLLLLQELASSAGPEQCRLAGADLAASAARVGLLALADGSAYPLQTPVGDDGRGGAYDDAVVNAVCAADVGALLRLDPADDGPLWAAGRPALQALAGALQRPLAGRVLWRGDPYGVGYFVLVLA